MGARGLCKALVGVRSPGGPPKMKFINCINCGKERVVTHSGPKSPNKYCTQICQNDFQFKNSTLKKFYEGKVSNRRTLKRTLISLYGNVCVDCGNTGEHNGKELKLQLDHKDGNASNDMPDNVRLLCPNCHSQTPTFTAKNKGNGRGSRQINR
jgi:hypothetical protein